MRNLPRILIATALSTLALSTVSLATWADDGDPVKTSRPPYKPGRELDDDGVQPVKPGRAPYKPGRQADQKQDSSDSVNN